MRRSHELVVLFLLFCIDRITKYIALVSALSYSEVTSFLAWDLSFNRGIAFAIGSSLNTKFFCLLTLLIWIITIYCCVLTYIRSQMGKSIFILGLLSIGALSNALDRLLYGGVIDFILVHYGAWYWPTFNLADIYICGAVALLIWDYNEHI